MGKGNKIDSTALIDDNVVLGNYNFIGKNVTITGSKGKEKIYIGDCNYIHDNTRILIGDKGCVIGDWNVFHNNMLLMGHKKMEIGHNCWFGQNTILDASGGLNIGNGVRVGMYSQIWTHVASGELIEGCTLHGQRETIIEDEVWLVGSCVVASGLTLGYRSTCLINSNITKNIEKLKVYGGNPAKLLEKLSFWKEVTEMEKYEMMKMWSNEYKNKNPKITVTHNLDLKKITLSDHSSTLIIGFEEILTKDESVTFFNLRNKTYTKRLTNLERNFYKYLFGNKARFTPL